MADADYPATNDTRASGSKRSIRDVENDEKSIRSIGDVENDEKSKKARKEVEESDPGVAAAMILSLHDSLQKCKDDLASSQNELALCQNELETAKTEVNKWKSAFEKESFVPARTPPEPRFVIDYIEKLRSSKEQLEIAINHHPSVIGTSSRPLIEFQAAGMFSNLNSEFKKFQYVRLTEMAKALSKLAARFDEMQKR